MRHLLIIPLLTFALCNPHSAQLPAGIPSDKAAAATHKVPKWQPGAVLADADVASVGAEHFFSSEPISDAVFQRMRKGGSYPANCTIPRSSLRYLKLLHVNYNGETVCGEMVCNEAIANKLYSIFLELYRQRYPIERMELIDNYNADDETSMRHNNTSCFCYRTVKGTKTLSKHSRGMAIDINPLHNPCVKRDGSGRITKLQPNTDVARRYAVRTDAKPHMITTKDPCYALFLKHGFKWGGAWRTVKDYQHFEF